MTFIKTFSLIIFIALLGQTLAYDVNSVKINCPEKKECLFLQKRIELAILKSKEKSELIENIRFMILDPMVSKFSFSFKVSKEGGVDFFADADLSNVVTKVSFVNSPLPLKASFGGKGIKEGEKFDRKKVLESIKEIKDQLKLEGYLQPKVWYRKKLLEIT